MIDKPKQENNIQAKDNIPQENTTQDNSTDEN